MEIPEVRFTTTPDGVNIAYQTWGEGDANIVMLSNLPNALDARWRLSRFREYTEALGRNVMMDLRGNGASDAVPLDQLADLEDWAVDVLAVMDACDMSSGVLLADAVGGYVALTVAARAPERVERLWLANGLLGQDPGLAHSAVEFVANAWGTGRVTGAALPDMGMDRARHAERERSMAPRNVATELVRRLFSVDVTEIARNVEAPTVVAYTGDLAMVTIDQSRALADTMPNAEFVDFSSSADLYVPVEAQAIEVFEQFLAGHTVERSEQELTTIVFTDIAGSTALAARHGDARWRSVLDTFDDAVRTVVEGAGGRVVKHTGDGHLVLAASPATAVRMARTIVTRAHTLGFDVRCGIHTGMVTHRGSDVTGIAVNTASRVMEHAGAGEVLVSRTVTDLVAGSGLEFEDRGTHELKGVPGEWQLFEVIS